MKRIRIVHETQYHYNQPVKFGPHRALLRPREGHDVHISRSHLSVAPAAAVRWLRDIYGNSIAVLTFEESSQRLSVASEVDVELYDDNRIECLIEPTAREFPFQDYRHTTPLSRVQSQFRIPRLFVCPLPDSGTKKKLQVS